jgi:molybdopterin converting factor small subunit
MPFSVPYRCTLSVEIELFGQLATAAERQQILTLEKSMTVQEVAILLGLDPEEIGLISINGVQSELEDLVPQDCRLCFFPPISGG